MKPTTMWDSKQIMWEAKQSAKPHSKRFYTNVLFGLNIIHIAIGTLSVGFALSQFAPVNLGSTFIDFRLLNFSFIIVGAAGLHMLTKNFGSVIVKALYSLSFLIGVWSCAFYADCCVEEVKIYDSMLEIRKLEGGEELISEHSIGNQVGKIIICALMIVLGGVGALNSFVSMMILNVLASDSYSNLKNPHRSMHRRQMAFVALMKIFFSLATMSLGAYLESLYKEKGHFIKIGWQEIAGGLGFVSGVLDLHALYSNVHNLLNLKVSLIVSVLSAVFSLKTLDYCMVNYLVIDLRDYARFDTMLLDTASMTGANNASSEKDRQQVFVKFVIHASVIGCLVLLFAHSVIAAVESGSYIEWTSAPVDESRIDWKLQKQRNRLAILQCLWGIGLVALTIISLTTWNFSKGYEGGSGVLWLGCLFVASGAVTANRVKTFTVSIYVMACISSIVSLEFLLYSLNFIYQSVRNVKFQSEIQEPISYGNYDTHVGRIVLYSIQAGILICEFFTASYTAYTFSCAIKSFRANVAKSCDMRGPLCSLGFFHLIYAFVTIAVSIAAEVAIWKFHVPVQPTVFITNGVIVFVNVVVQWSAGRRPQFLLPSAVLNIICAGIAFFVIAPYTTYLYNQVAAYRTADEMHQFDDQSMDNQQKKIVQEWIIGLTAVILCLAIAEYAVAILSGMICSYILHHQQQSEVSDLRFSTLKSQAHTLPRYYNGDSKLAKAPSIISNGYKNGLVNNGYTNGHAYPNGHATQERYFGNDCRTYAERMYNPNEVVFKNGDTTYGVHTSHHYRPETTKSNNHAETNIRHVFQNGYMSSYS